MKKTLTILFASLLTGFTFSQTTSTILLEEDFSTSENEELSSNIYGPLISNTSSGFDGERGSSEFILEDSYSEFIWSGEVPANTDSIFIEYKIDQSTFSGGFLSNSFNQLIGSNVSFYDIEYKGVRSTIFADRFFSFGTSYSIIDSSSFYYVTSKIDIDNTVSPYTFAKVESYTDIFSGAQDFCNTNFPNDFECVDIVQDLVFFATEPTFIRVDDFKVIAYSSSITGLNDDINEDKKIVASYNLVGLPIDEDTKNEVIILKYSDGSSERVFNQ